MRPALAIALAVAFAAVIGGVGFAGARLVLAPAALVDAESPWREADWPFLRDGWPAGRAFRCDAGHCGEEVMVYARVKAGMCDCSAGVVDDEDLERVSDAGLISPRLAPEGAGEAQDVAGLKARLRRYRFEGGGELAVWAGGRNCNAIVAMATARHALSPDSMALARALLNDPAMTRWIAGQGR